jgi:hypothetical protein
LTPLSTGEGVGIFRLRMPIRFALRHAPLKMTECEVRRLEAPLFHGVARSVRASCEIKIKIEIKSSGLECPLHTSRVDMRVELLPFPLHTSVAALR